MSLVLLVLSLIIPVVMGGLQDPDSYKPDQKVQTGTKVGTVTTIVLVVLFFGVSILGAIYFKFKKAQSKSRGATRDVEIGLYKLPDHEARAHGAGRHYTHDDTLPRAPPIAITH